MLALFSTPPEARRRIIALIGGWLALLGNPERSLLRFGVFELDLKTGELHKAGSLINLSPQPFKILVLLASRPGQLVTREEIQRQVWGSDVFVDFEQGLNFAVKKIRAALSDDAESPRYIETLPRRGYRFIAPVEVVPASILGDPASSSVDISEPAVMHEDSPPAFSAARPVRTRFWMWLLAAVPVVLAAIYGVQHIPSPAAISLTVSPLTAYPGKEVQPSLSPDGNHVAFAFNGGRASNYDIYVKVIGSEEITRLTSDPADDLSPSWSPDSQNIVFLRFVSDQSARVMVVPSAGGAERQLAELQVEHLLQPEIRVAWSPDGEWIATSDQETSLSPMRLVLISSRTGRKRRLNYQAPTAVSDLSPSFSPDGRYLAYARHINEVVADIYVLEIPKEGGPAIKARPLTYWNRWNRSPVWSGDGKEIFFVGDEPRIGSRIWRVPAFTRGDARRINDIGEASTSIALSLSGNRLVYSKEIDDWNIWRLDLTPASGARAKKQVSTFPVIASTYWDGQPQYSPDGKYITFQSDRSGDSEIWIANSDGSASRQLTRMRAKISGYPRWSPDGKYIVFHSRLSGYANLYIVNVETGSYRALTTGTTNDAAPSWSHDGKWIYFTSERNSGHQIWRIPAEGGPASQLTKNGGVIAFDSVDGKLLYYSKFNESGLWMLSLQGGTESQVLPSLYTFDAFAITKAGIYFARRTANNEAEVCFMSFSPRLIQELARIKSPFEGSLAVSPDGSSLLYGQGDQSGSDLILVDNLK